MRARLFPDFSADLDRGADFDFGVTTVPLASHWSDGDGVVVVRGGDVVRLSLREKHSTEPPLTLSLPVDETGVPTVTRLARFLDLSRVRVVCESAATPPEILQPRPLSAPVL